MKSIHEMTDQEILALTPEELEHMVKLRMAEEGIKMLPQPLEPKMLSIPPKDDFAFAISGVDMLFREREDATAVADFLVGCKAKALVIDYSPDYNYQHLAPAGDTWSSKELCNVTRKEFYRKDTLAAAKKGLEANAKTKKQYDSDMAEYRQTLSDSESIREEIHGKYNEVVDKYESDNNIITGNRAKHKIAPKVVNHGKVFPGKTENFYTHHCPTCNRQLYQEMLQRNIGACDCGQLIDIEY